MKSTAKSHITLPDGRLVKVSYSTCSSTETEKLRKAAEETGRVAVKTAFAHGLPVTVGKDGNIVKIYPDGHEEIIGALAKI